jgi:hypothetical protein
MSSDEPLTRTLALLRLPPVAALLTMPRIVAVAVSAARAAETRPIKQLKRKAANGTSRRRGCRVAGLKVTVFELLEWQARPWVVRWGGNQVNPTAAGKSLRLHGKILRFCARP